MRVARECVAVVIVACSLGPLAGCGARVDANHSPLAAAEPTRAAAAKNDDDAVAEKNRADEATFMGRAKKGDGANYSSPARTPQHLRARRKSW